MRLSVSRSRDHLCSDLHQPSTAQSRDRLRNFSKSHEVLSLLSGDQSSSLSTPTYERQTSLFHIVPLAQSLDCFVVPPLEQVGQVAKQQADANALPISNPPPPPPLPEGLLCGTLSESTETLCDEKEVPSTQPEEVTPSNSRPASPIEKSSKADSSNEIMKAAESSGSPVSTRAEAVASSLKRLSRIGPPPLQITTPAEVLTPPAIKSPWNWPAATEPSTDKATSSRSSHVPSSPTPSPSYSIRKLMFPAPAKEKTSPTSPTPSSTPRPSSTDSAKLSPQPTLEHRSTEIVRPRLSPSLPPPTTVEDRTQEITRPRLSSSTPIEQQPTESFRLRYSSSNITPMPPSAEPDADASRSRFSSSATLEQQSSDTARASKRNPTTIQLDSFVGGEPVRPRFSTSTSSPAEQSTTDAIRSRNLISSSTIRAEQPTDTQMRSRNIANVLPTSSTEGQEQRKEFGRSRQISRTDTNPTPIDTSSLSESQRQILPSILNRRRASWAYGSKQEDVAAPPPVRSLLGKKIEPKLSVSELITNFSQGPVPGTVAMAKATVTTASTGLIKPSSVKKLSVGTIFHHDTTANSASASTTKLAEKEKPVTASVQGLKKTLLPQSSSAASSVLPATQRSTDRPRPHHFSWDVRALPRLAEDPCSPPTEGPPSGSALIAPSDNLGHKSNPVETKDTDALNKKTTTQAPPSEPDADFGLRSGSVSSDTGCSSSSDLSDRSSEDVSDRSTRRRGVGIKSSKRSEPESMQEVVAESGPPPGWTGRPRSFSVQADISFLAQPWNRVCTGSVARAFEKFGTKVEENTTPAPSTSQFSSSRRQSTPGPFK